MVEAVATTKIEAFMNDEIIRHTITRARDLVNRNPPARRLTHRPAVGALNRELTDLCVNLLTRVTKDMPRTSCACTSEDTMP